MDAATLARFSYLVNKLNEASASPKEETELEKLSDLISVAARPKKHAPLPATVADAAAGRA